MLQGKTKGSLTTTNLFMTFETKSMTRKIQRYCFVDKLMGFKSDLQQRDATLEILQAIKFPPLQKAQGRDCTKKA
jgi:hypothetical protein